MSKSTWLLDSVKSEWTMSTSPSTPSAYQSFATAYDTRSRKLVLFGGSTGYQSNETWIYDGASDRWTERTDDERWEWFSVLLGAIWVSAALVSVLIRRERRADRGADSGQAKNTKSMWRPGIRAKNTAAFALSTTSVFALSILASLGSDSLAGLPLASCCPILLLLLFVVAVGARPRDGNEISNWSAVSYAAIGYTNGGLVGALAGLAITFAPRASIPFYFAVAAASALGVLASSLIASSPSRRQPEPSASALGFGSVLLIMAGGLVMTGIAIGTSGTDGYCPACGLLSSAIPLAFAALGLLPVMLVAWLVVRRTGPAKPIPAVASIVIATFLVGTSILMLLSPRAFPSFAFALCLTLAGLASIHSFCILTARTEPDTRKPRSLGKPQSEPIEGPPPPRIEGGPPSRRAIPVDPLPLPGSQIEK